MNIIDKTGKKLEIKFADDNDNIRVIKDSEKITLKFLVPHRLEISINDKEMRDAAIILLLSIRDMEGKKVINQEGVGKAFDLSRQMINRRWMTFKEEGLCSLLKNEYEKSKLTSKVKERIVQLVSSNWHFGDKEIAERLIEEGLVEDITPACVRLGIKGMDGVNVRRLMRQRISKGEIGNSFSRDYVIERLFEMVNDLLEGGERGEFLQRYQEIVELIESPKSEAIKTNKYHRNTNKERKYLQRDKQRKENALIEEIEGIERGEVVCPDCMSLHVVKKEKRQREYIDLGGEKKISETNRFYCKNEYCSTKTFTLNPDFLEQWARVSKVVKKKGLQLVVHVRGSYRRAMDYLREEEGIRKSWVSLLNWVRKAGAECVEIEKMVKVKWSGKVVIDEKWVKLYKEWIYIYKAIDAVTGEALVQEVYPHKGKESAKSFLIKVKMLGYYPNIIVTDLCEDYNQPAKEIFPLAVHHQCILHAERRSTELMREYLYGEENKWIRDMLKPLIRALFGARDVGIVAEKYKELMSQENSLPEVAKPIFSLIRRYYPKLYRCIEDIRIPKTTNACENAIKGFEMKYQNTYGYCNIYAIRDFLRLYTIYERLSFRSSGRYKGKSPNEVLNGRIKLGWIKWIMADWGSRCSSLSFKEALKMSNEKLMMKEVA